MLGRGGAVVVSMQIGIRDRQMYPVRGLGDSLDPAINQDAIDAWGDPPLLKDRKNQAKAMRRFARNSFKC
jgi:hypothetical protein